MPIGLALLGGMTLVAWSPGVVEAIQGKAYDQARRMVAEGADLGRRDDRGYTALMLAVEHHQVDLAEELIEAGVDLGAQDSNGSLSALRMALMYHEPAVVRKILQAGADPNERCVGGSTPLSSVGPSVEMLEALLAAGADPNVQDDQGFTVLMRNSIEGPPNKVRVLLASGARTDVYNAEGQTAMSIARTYGNAKVRDLLCEHGVPDVDELPPTLKDPALDFAAKALGRGELHLVMGLAAAGIDLRSQVSPGLTLLHYAARWGAPEAVPSLLEAIPSFPVDVANGWGHTPLWFAVLAGRVDVARLLVRQGASLQAKDARQRTPLDAAILNDDLSMVSTLLELGAPVGQAQLSYAVSNDRVEILDSLIPHAKPKDLVGFTAGAAAMVGAPRCAVYFFRRQPHDTDLAAVAQHGDDRLVRELIRLGANVHPKNGSSPLIIAAARGFTDAVRAMLDVGADPNATPEGGAPSALSAAASAGHADVIRILCDAGADPEFEDYRGYTTLAAAARAGHVDAVRGLLAGGARLNARDRYGLSAWQHAIRGRHEDVARLLVDAGASTLDFEAYLWRRIARDGLLTLACWIGLVRALGRARSLLRPAGLGLLMGAGAACFASCAVGFLVPGFYLDVAEAIDPPYFRLIVPSMAIVLVIAIALHGAALVVVGKLCRSRILAAFLVLTLSLGPGVLAWRSWFPDMSLVELLKLTGLPFVALAAAIEMRHRDPRLGAAGTRGALVLAAAASVVPLLCGFALIQPPW